MAYSQNILSTSGVVGITGGWTGSYQNTYGFSSIRVSWFCDVDTTVNIRQGGDTGTTMFVSTALGVANKASTFAVPIYETYANVDISFVSPPNSFNLDTFFFPNSITTSSSVITLQLTGATGSVSFNNIDQGGSKLIISGNVACDSNTMDNIAIRINGDIWGNYTWQEVYGVGPNAGAFGQGDDHIRVASVGTTGWIGPIFSAFNLEFPNYNNAFISKSSISISGAYPDDIGKSYVLAFGGWWPGTSPITDVEIYTEGGSNFITNSIFNLQIV